MHQTRKRRSCNALRKGSSAGKPLRRRSRASSSPAAESRASGGSESRCGVQVAMICSALRTRVRRCLSRPSVGKTLPSLSMVVRPTAVTVRLPTSSW